MSRMETRPERHIKLGRALHVSASNDLQAPSSARPSDATKRDPSSCQNALAKALPGIKTTVFRASLTVRPPLRTSHGTTSPVAGIQTQQPENKTKRPSKKYGAA